MIGVDDDQGDTGTDQDTGNHSQGREGIRHTQTAQRDGLYDQDDRESFLSHPLEEGGALNHLGLLQLASKSVKPSYIPSCSLTRSHRTRGVPLGVPEGPLGERNRIPLSEGY